MGGEINFPRKCERGKIEENWSIRFANRAREKFTERMVENGWKNRFFLKIFKSPGYKNGARLSLGSAVSHFSSDSPNANRQRSFIFMPLRSLSLRKRRASLTERKREFGKAWEERYDEPVRFSKNPWRTDVRHHAYVSRNEDGNLHEKTTRCNENNIAMERRH